MTGSSMCASTSAILKVKHYGPKDSLMTNFSEKVLKSGVDILLHRLSKGALTSVHNKQCGHTREENTQLNPLIEPSALFHAAQTHIRQNQPRVVCNKLVNWVEESLCTHEY